MFGQMGKSIQTNGFGDIGDINLSEDKELRIFLITNNKPNNHDRVINRLILSSEEIILCSGWLKLEGIDMVLPSIICAENNGADITLFSNKGETGVDCDCEASEVVKHYKEPVKHWLERRKEMCSCIGIAEKIIAKLEKVSKKHPKFKYVVYKNSNKPMHQKIYYFKKDNEFTAIIGSGNITQGGLESNEELSVGFSGPIGSYSHKEIIKYLDKMNDESHLNDGIELDGWKFVDKLHTDIQISSGRPQRRINFS
jgi:hypothetical protein